MSSGRCINDQDLAEKIEDIVDMILKKLLVKYSTNEKFARRKSGSRTPLFYVLLLGLFLGEYDSEKFTDSAISNNGFISPLP